MNAKNKKRTGRVTRNNVIVVKRLRDTAEDFSLGYDCVASAWRAVERRDTNTEPTAPGRPLPESMRRQQKRRMFAHTSDNDRQKTKAFVSVDEAIKNHASSRRDYHSAKEWNPTQGYERANIFIANSQGNCKDSAKYADDE